MSREDVDGNRSVVEFEVSAGVLGERDPTVGDLPVAGVTAQLEDGFMDLAEPCGADGVATGDETAAGVHGDASAE